MDTPRKIKNVSPPPTAISPASINITTTSPQPSCIISPKKNYHSGTTCNIDLSYCIVWSPIPFITWLVPFVGHTGICNSNGIASDFRGPYYVGTDGQLAFGNATRYLRIIPTTSMNTTTEPLKPLSSSPSSLLYNNTTNTNSTHNRRHRDNDNDLETTFVSVHNNNVDVNENESSLHESIGMNHHHSSAKTTTITKNVTTTTTTTITATIWDHAINEANQIYNERMHNLFCDNCHSHVAYALNEMHGVNAYGIYKWNMINIATIIFFRATFVSYTAILQQFGPFMILCAIIFIVSK